MNEYSRKIQYSGSQNGYLTWADAMWSLGYNLSIQTVTEKLNVSISWINHTLLHEINYVVYSVKYAWEVHHSRNLTYIREDDFIDWMLSVAKFEVQTEPVDLYSYIENRKVANQILKFYNEDFKQNEGFYNKGTLPPKTIKFIEAKCYISGFELKNLNCAKRSKVPFVSVKPFNFLPNDFYMVSGVAETVYREAFLRGDIKVKIGSKTYFVPNKTNIDDFKIPFIIPYGKTVKLRSIS